jgi:hypothetical protein
MKKLLILMVLVLVLPACAPSAADFQVAIAQTQAAYTPTPVPPTNTPVPTATITPTSTPVYALWTVDQASALITAAGLEFVNPRPMTKDDYGPAPMTAKEAIYFQMPSLCSDCEGRLYSFASQSDLESLQSYYVDLGKVSAFFFSWVFVKDNILIQLIWRSS